MHYLGQIYGSFALNILFGVVVSELVLDRVQDEPALLPRLQQCASLVEVALENREVYTR